MSGLRNTQAVFVIDSNHLLSFLHRKTLEVISLPVRGKWKRLHSTAGLSHLRSVKLWLSVSLAATFSVRSCGLWTPVCMPRLPRITQPLRREEEEMAALMGQIELEKSRYSDHEIRKLEEEEQLKRRKESMYDDDEGPGKTVIMAQDLEDKWEQKLLQFKAAPRITGTDRSRRKGSNI
uniref:Mitochondrial ribosomal protein L46 n=1 Tax=Dromaius novaehollandiae TaxID=8790 RepID=A0A8C4JGU6_DRONO